jgi:undecaprenyl pyrophosphate synthase
VSGVYKKKGKNKMGKDIVDIGLGAVIGVIVAAGFLWFKVKKLIKEDIVEPEFAKISGTLNVISNRINDFKTEIKEDIKKLETKQEVYNNLQLQFARHVGAYEEIKATIFKRIDELRRECRNDKNN